MWCKIANSGIVRTFGDFNPRISKHLRARSSSVFAGSLLASVHQICSSTKSHDFYLTNAMMSVIGIMVLLGIASFAQAENCAKGWTLNPHTGKCFYIRLGFDLNHHQCAARCHALHARLPCINGPQDEKFFPQVYPMPQENPPDRSMYLARTHRTADKDVQYSWGDGCSSNYTNFAPNCEPSFHCATIQYNLHDTDWITIDCDLVMPGTRALCVCEGSVGEDLLLPAGDNVIPPPYCPSSYFVRNPENFKCYSDRTSIMQQGLPCNNACWDGRRPDPRDLQDPIFGTFLEKNFPGYIKYPDPSYSHRCFCERDGSYLYFGYFQFDPPPFSCPASYSMDPVSAQCTRDISNPTSPTDPVPADPVDPADPTHPTSPTDDAADPAEPKHPTSPTDDAVQWSREQVLIGVVVLAVIVVVVLLIVVVVLLYTQRSNMSISGYQRVQQTIPMLPMRQARRPQQEFQATVQATVYNPTSII